MHLRFVLGPAGTGKTWLCLDEIRRALAENPEGPPLILLAPRQATYQLERQLLESGLQGYARLRIFSFERLAQWVLKELRLPRPPLLSEEGRSMVFRALLARAARRLRIFHASSMLEGFARQLSAELREIQQRGLSPEALQALARRADLSESLRNKLHDLAILLDDYLRWLGEHHLEDGSRLFDLAANALENARDAGREILLKIEHLWLDGFAELTLQETALLVEVAQCCRTATLAFCVDTADTDPRQSWLSIWSGIQRARSECADALQSIAGATSEIIRLERDKTRNRFADSLSLRYLEQIWDNPDQQPGIAPEPDSIRVADCPTFYDEATFAAREILRFVREKGGRFREVAVLLRSMEGNHDDLRRVFTRYQIPFFLDRRQTVAHHPLAELTRNALRLLHGGWRHEDWFAALKTGLVDADQEAIDRLENEALQRGWNGNVWKMPFSKQIDATPDAELLRARWVAPFLELTDALSPASGRPGPTGSQLANGFRELWKNLRVEQTLQAWSERHAPNGADSGELSQIHTTVWQQMNVWLGDLELAFGAEALPLAEWLPILEAGLGGLTVGVIPPALDQVLIGAVDRSRNPDLQLVLILGINETIFPSDSTQGRLLNESDRDELVRCNVPLGLSGRQFLSREHFLGYIACTRARAGLVVTFARQDASGRALNPSLFISHLQRIFPTLKIEEFAGPDWTHPEHACETTPLAAECARQAGEKDSDWKKLSAIPAIASEVGRVGNFARAGAGQSLSPALAEQLYGPALRTSVSSLEYFSACSFRFFLQAGLKIEERKLLELEAREKGTFMHEVLAAFHQSVKGEGLKWHDILPKDARDRVAALAEKVIPSFAEGLLAADPRSRFSARMMTRSLQDCVESMVVWMSQYNFEPRAVELGFGKKGELPAWELDLGGGHRLVFSGRIDRVDLCPSRDNPDAAFVVIIDYKSSTQKLEAIKLENGAQLQLPSYLAVMQNLADPKTLLGSRHLIPAGVFYVNVRGDFPGAETRDDVLSREAASGKQSWQHRGRFNEDVLPDLDNRNADTGTQFNFKFKRDGSLYANCDGMSSEAFNEMLRATEDHLRRIGREVFAGNIELNPYQNGKSRPCDFCLYHGVCRIDPWTHSFRELKRKPPGLRSACQ